MDVFCVSGIVVTEIPTTKKDLASKELESGRKNIQNEKLVASEDVLLPPLHIKLGLIKQLVKAMNQSGQGFMYLSKKFPRLSSAKIKEWVLVGPQIRELQKDSHFEECLSPKKKKCMGIF